MALSLAGQSDAAVEVDRIAQAHREEFDMHETPAFWTALRERHVGAAVRAVGEARVAALRSRSLDIPHVERQRALALADSVLTVLALRA